ncbi:POC1 centriolar protein A, partial [Ceratobasidium sp. 370]
KANWLDEDVKQLLRDAWMFITSFSSTPAMLSTPHIYVSTLPFWPDNRPITKHYPQQQPHLISRASTAMGARGVIPLAVLNTGGGIASLAYSPDGAYIASSSRDKTIRIWDARTGQSVGQPLQGHTSWVNSVAYSPDGAYIVSGSRDKTICIWDARTGQNVGQPLQGHTHSVNSVEYSPDGAYIVSGSDDKTIRIWDTRTGQSVGQPLQGHTGWANPVAYSPDGAYIVSGSYDNTIRIWDAGTGQGVGQPLQGHTDWVSSVAYSPDGAYIVSGSYDKTIRIWDACTGQSVGQPLQGHTYLVYSVAYSPDGAYIVSGSSDSIIRVWDMQSAAMMNDMPESGNHSAQSIIPPNSIPSTQHADPHICNPGCRINGYHTVWALDSDGWVTIQKSKLLVWIPPDLRDILLLPRNTAMISTRGFLQLDFDYRRIGDHWRTHFQPEKSSRTEAQ